MSGISDAGAFRNSAIVAGILFIVATSATMVSQIIIGPIIAEPDIVASVSASRSAFTLGVVLELANSLASAGIAIAMFPVLRRCIEGVAVGYVGFRVIEAALGIVAAIGLFSLLTLGESGFAAGASGSQDLSAFALAFHDWAFLLLLIVFSLSTLMLYPILFRFRLVPVFISLWGLIGGLMLLASNLLILFGPIEFGTTADTLLSLPIWINEMVLALWLIFKGFNPSAILPEPGKRSAA